MSASLLMWEIAVRSSAVIHSNLRLPLLCRNSPFLLSFSQWGQQRKQGGGGDCLFLSRLIVLKVIFPLKPPTFNGCCSGHPALSPNGNPARQNVNKENISFVSCSRGRPAVVPVARRAVTLPASDGGGDLRDGLGIPRLSQSPRCSRSPRGAQRHTRR